MSKAVTVSRADVLAAIAQVMDPEVPVLSVVELGIVRDAELVNGRAVITVTPTYSGCPAMQVIEREISAAVEALGVEVEVKTSFTPPWTTDWIPAAAREKLRKYGIAPPGATDHDAPIAIGRRRPAVRCPYCGSAETVMRSEFGSTACKSIHVCASCRQPFEEFKPI